MAGIHFSLLLLGFVFDSVVDLFVYLGYERTCLLHKQRKTVWCHLFCANIDLVGPWFGDSFFIRFFDFN